MIQRIQTLYLLLIVALSVAMLFLPLAVVQSGNQLFSFDVTGLYTTLGEPELVFATWGLFALTAVMSLLALVTIFMYKKRLLQIRFCVFNALLMIGFYALFGFFIWTFKGQMTEASVSVKFALSFPMISLIFDYLAIRNIGADEALVRSLNRLR